VVTRDIGRGVINSREASDDADNTRGERPPRGDLVKAGMSGSIGEVTFSGFADVWT